ncbi:MAG: hypothetical protein YK1312THETA_10003 [Marine Group I thaumarchaeote]|jgi:uncharacterized protein YlxW (UPF0749 family)|nr:MAG: hypothetical protein YK1312THETA_10003 [Marine Group I thaumarchaeote]
MNEDLQQEIKTLQNEIVREENKIIDYQNNDDSKSMKKSIATIHSDLKYLSIIANGAPIDPKQNMKIREFLRIHLENLWRMRIPV